VGHLVQREHPQNLGRIGVVIVKYVGLLGYIWADYIYVLDAVAYFVDSDAVDVGVY